MLNLVGLHSEIWYFSTLQHHSAVCRVVDLIILTVELSCLQSGLTGLCIVFVSWLLWQQSAGGEITERCFRLPVLASCDLWGWWDHSLWSTVECGVWWCGLTPATAGSVLRTEAVEWSGVVEWSGAPGGPWLCCPSVTLSHGVTTNNYRDQPTTTGLNSNIENSQQLTLT